MSIYEVLNMVAYILKSVYNLCYSILFYKIDLTFLNLGSIPVYMLLGVLGVGVFITILIIKAIRG